jgi:RNA polymerase sigma-70 factor (ECF subfamily)
MPPNPSFADLMARLRAGDPEAAQQVFQRFARRLIGLAGTRLDGLLRQKVDPDDVMQSAFRSFFSRQADGQFELQSWDSLWALLAVITIRKCGRVSERYYSAARDVNREVAAGEDDETGEDPLCLSREPTPAEAAILADMVESLMRLLSSRDRQIVSLSLQGYTPQEVGEKIGRSERTVQRVLKDVRAWLQEKMM